MEVDITRFRRLSLAIDLILLSNSHTCIASDTPAKISQLGISLKIKHPELLGIGLFLCSIYTTLRYWFYAVLTGITPKVARERLMLGYLPNGSKSSSERTQSTNLKDIDTYKFIVGIEVEKYFPVFPRQEKTK